MAMLGISERHDIDHMVIRCIAIIHICFNWPYQFFSESHTQSQPFRPLPCDHHDHNILTYICLAMIARLLVLAYGTANAIMQVWNGSICALGAVGEPEIIVTLMMMSSEHNRFLYYIHVMYQLCWTLTVSPNLISISVPSLLCHGMVFITITLLCIHVKMLWSWHSSHGRGLTRWIPVRDSEQLICPIETCTFHLNASYYHLIDEVTLIDTRHGHMVFLTKLTD